MLLKVNKLNFYNFGLNYLIYNYDKLLVIIYYSNNLFYIMILRKNNFDLKKNVLLNLYRLTYLYNPIKLVNKYYYYEIMLDGLYYRVKYYKKYNCLGFSLGYNHYILYFVPNNIKLFFNKIRRRFILYGIDKSLLGRIASEIVNLKYPNLFKGRGVKIINYNYRRKILVKKK